MLSMPLTLHSNNYYVIEVNPRVSRSSALASKATGYPIAKVASKIAIGYHLDEIQNAVTKKTMACFEPALDYIVVKFPRWPFDKFIFADRTLGTQMKATGEVMSIDRSFEGALLKAVRSLEIGVHRLSIPEIASLSTEEVRKKLALINDERIFMVAEALRREISVDEIHKSLKLIIFSSIRLKNIIKMEVRLQSEDHTPELMLAAKKLGFADKSIAESGKTIEEIRAERKQQQMYLVTKW